MPSIIERHICNWKRDSTEKSAVGELVIAGNQIEFYVKDVGNASPATYIGSDTEHHIKVVTNGTDRFGANNTLDLAMSYNVRYVLKQNFAFAPGCEISNITGFSFRIPELMDWFHGIRTVEMLPPSEEGEFRAGEINLPEIVLHDQAPHIFVAFESSSINETMRVDSRTEIIIKNQPRLYVQYDTTVTTEQVRRDVRCLMQFWGLMIGTVTDAIDIRLDIEGEVCKSWLYMNGDFSYNTSTRRIFNRPRTTLGTVDEKISTYFANWYDFYYNEKFDLVRNMYFSANNRKSIFAEDIFVLYVKILEGYHLRISGDEHQANILKEAIKVSRKEIKHLIFTKEGAPLFSKALEEAVPGWTFNSSHANEIANWIATGFLGRTGLAERLKQLDNEFFRVIASNASVITDRSGQITDPETEEHYYKMIVATRNYYSHFKNDKTDVFTFTQLHDSIFVLKSLILMILFSNMGVSHEDIRIIMSWDMELGGRTGYLRKSGEKPPVE